MANSSRLPNPNPSPKSHVNRPKVKRLTLETTHRLTPSISLHVFSFPGHEPSARNLRPSQHITLQFPDNLDPIGGSRNIAEEDRCLVFTPCQLSDTREDCRLLSLLARNGRVTGLLGLPRPTGPLTAEFVSFGGGFPREILHQGAGGGYSCIAGGTGIACFAALSTAVTEEKQALQDDTSLFWSIRSDDFRVVEHLLDSSTLRVTAWARISIFITAGDEPEGFIGGKPATWWQRHLSNFAQHFPSSVEFKLRRMEQSDLGELEPQRTILFCGSKSFEWQVKMWALGGPAVYTTQRT